MFKFLNQCFAQLRFWKSVLISQNLLDGATAVLLETLFQNRSRAKHWFKNLNILDTLFVTSLNSGYAFFHTLLNLLMHLTENSHLISYLFFMSLNWLLNIVWFLNFCMSTTFISRWKLFEGQNGIKGLFNLILDFSSEESWLCLIEMNFLQKMYIFSSCDFSSVCMQRSMK